MRINWPIAYKRVTLFIIHDCEITTRHTLTLTDKIQLIRESEQEFSYHELADKYKDSIGSISNIIKRKAEYMEDYEQNGASVKKHNPGDEFSQQLDEIVYEWFVQTCRVFLSARMGTRGSLL